MSNQQPQPAGLVTDSNDILHRSPQAHTGWVHGHTMVTHHAECIASPQMAGSSASGGREGSAFCGQMSAEDGQDH